MVANEPPDATAGGRIGIIQAVQTPLGFFVLVVLIVEAIFGVFVFKLDAGVDRTFVIQCMIVLIFSLILIVTGMAIWRPLALSGKEPLQKEISYSLLIGPPKNSRPRRRIKEDNVNMALLDLINWDKDACFLVCDGLREKIDIVRARPGNTFRVIIPHKLWEKVKEHAIRVELKDKKGLRWALEDVSIENVISLSWVESREQVMQAYGEEDQ
jgi:hypothetical protein